jgi:hypothetical protein
MTAVCRQIDKGGQTSAFANPPNFLMNNIQIFLIAFLFSILVLNSAGFFEAIEELRTRSSRFSIQLAQAVSSLDAIDAKISGLETLDVLAFYTKIYPDNPKVQSIELYLADLNILREELSTTIASAQELAIRGEHRDGLLLLASRNSIALPRSNWTNRETFWFRGIEQLSSSVEARIEILSSEIDMLDTQLKKDAADV